ncbi:MAG: hypothetical protein MUF01_12735 [Bryobacterales bacterium]|jgi:hypothetical protein|nr:hypothetical protein [Bryobacterales bacterium]
MKQYNSGNRRGKTVTELRGEERFSESLYAMALVIRQERRVEKQRPQQDRKGYKSDAA